MGCAESPVPGMLWVVMPGSGAAWRWGATRGPRCCREGTAWCLSTAPAPCLKLVPSHCGEADDSGGAQGSARVPTPSPPRAHLPSQPLGAVARARRAPRLPGCRRHSAFQFCLLFIKGKRPRLRNTNGPESGGERCQSASTCRPPRGHRHRHGQGGSRGASQQKMELSQNKAPRGPFGAGPWARGHRAGVAAEGTRVVPGDGRCLGAPLGARSLEKRGGGRCRGDGTDPSHGQGSRLAPCAHPAGL